MQFCVECGVRRLDPQEISVRAGVKPAFVCLFRLFTERQRNPELPYRLLLDPPDTFFYEVYERNLCCAPRTGAPLIRSPAHAPTWPPPQSRPRSL